MMLKEKMKMKKILENKNKKKFEKPELEIIEFTNDDIITDSFGDPNPGSGDVFPKGWW